MANTLNSFRQGVVGFIGWLDCFCMMTANDEPTDDGENNEERHLAERNLLKPIRQRAKNKQHKPHR